MKPMLHAGELTSFVLIAALAAAMLAAAVPRAALAQSENIQTLVGDGAWRAYTYTENGNKVCYMASEPRKHEGDYTRRGDIYAMVAHRPAENATNVVSFVIGYTFKQESTVDVRIDDKSFTLFTHEDTAWAPNSGMDAALVEAMRAGRSMVVKGTSSRGTLTTDTYTLIGFTNAHKAINSACNIQ
jgi:hypothetical protein